MIIGNIIGNIIGYMEGKYYDQKKKIKIQRLHARSGS